MSGDAGLMQEVKVMTQAVTGQALNTTLLFDSRPTRWRIGLIALSTDLTSERDFVTLCPSSEVAVYVNRVRFENPTTAENLRHMQPRLSAAADLILPGITLDAIAFACTAASALIGDDNVRAAVNQGKPDTPCITPTSGAIAGFQRLGVRRVSVLAPYTQSVSEDLAEYFSSQDLEVVSLHYMGLEDDRSIAQVQPSSIVEAALEACAVDADALFLSCTALRAVPVLHELETRLGKPVLSSNQAMFWQTLRLAGYDQPIAGYGQLLQLA